MFPSQIQCLWNIETDAASRIKIEFADWDLPVSRLTTAYKDAAQNTMCTLAYLQITYYNFKKNKSEVKVCGANPGFIISNGPRVQLQLHGSDDGRGGKFRLKLSRVPLNTPQRLLATDGRSVAEKIKPRPAIRQPSLSSSTSRLPAVEIDAEASENQNYDDEEKLSPKSSKLKWFIGLSFLFGVVGLVLIKITRKKSSTSTSSSNGPQDESVT